MQYYTQYTSTDSENHSNHGYDVEGCWSTGGADRYGQNMMLGSNAVDKQAQECHENHPEDELYHNGGYDVEGCGSTGGVGPNIFEQLQTHENCGYAGLDHLRHNIIYPKNNSKQYTTPSGGGDGGATSRHLTRQPPQNRREYKRPDKNMSESTGSGNINKRRNRRRFDDTDPTEYFYIW